MISILWSFVQPLLWASVVAVASWPMYRRFAERLPRSLASGATPLIFTMLVSLLVLAPIMFAFGALAVMARSWADEVALANPAGFAVPAGVESLPLVGTHLVQHWRARLSAPGGMTAWMQRVDTSAVFGWAQTLGQFPGRAPHTLRAALLRAHRRFRCTQVSMPESDRIRQTARQTTNTLLPTALNNPFDISGGSSALV